MSTPLDLAGKRFGRLTVIEATEDRVDGSIVWHCECDCGNFAKIPSRSLVGGHTQSCGCLFDYSRDFAGLMASRARRKLGLKVWGTLGMGTSRTSRPNFMSRRLGDESKAEVEKRVADRLRRGLCGDCGRPLSASIDGIVATLVCTCGFRSEVKRGSRAYRAVRLRVEMGEMDKAVGE